MESLQNTPYPFSPKLGTPVNLMVGWTDHHTRNCASVWKQGPRIQEFEADGSQRDGVKRLCKEEEVGYVDLWDSFVGIEEMYARDGLLPFLPRDCQGQLPVDWVKYDM